MAEGCDRIPLIADGSSTEIFAKRELDVQQYGSCKTGNDDGRFVTVRGDVDVDKAGSSADCGDRTKLVGEALNTDSQQPARSNLTDLIRRAGDAARKAAYNCRLTSGCCLSAMQNTLYVLNVGKARLSEAIASNEEAEQFDEATSNRALANKYDVAIELATTRIRQIEVVSKSAAESSISAYLTAFMISKLDEDETEVEEKLSITHDAANSANEAAIMVNRIEYAAVTAMKKCLKDIDPERLEFEAIINQSEELAISRNIHDTVAGCIFSVISFIIGVLLVASSLNNVKDNISILALGSIMVAVPVIYILYRIFMYCRNKHREALDKKNRNIVYQINKRILQLEKYFESNKISPEDTEQ